MVTGNGHLMRSKHLIIWSVVLLCKEHLTRGHTLLLLLMILLSIYIYLIIVKFTKKIYFFFNSVFGKKLNKKSKKVKTASKILYFLHMLVLFGVDSFLFIHLLVWMSFSGVFVLFCVISYVLRLWRQMHFSIFELLKI